MQGPNPGLKKYPIGQIELRIMSEVRELKCKRELDETTVIRVGPSASRTPRHYELSKIHNPDFSIQPVVSSIKSPTYHLAKYVHVTKVIGPLDGQTTSFVKNLHHFIEQVKNETIRVNEVMVSFDVKSLFTNFPLDDFL